MWHLSTVDCPQPMSHGDRETSKQCYQTLAIEYAIPVGTASTTGEQTKRIRNGGNVVSTENAPVGISTCNEVQPAVGDERLVADDDEVEVECITNGGGRLDCPEGGEIAISSILICPRAIDSVTVSPAPTPVLRGREREPVVIASVWALIWIVELS